MSTFNTFGFSEPILKAVAEMGFETPTPIQAQAFEILLKEDTDFLGLAQTGTGKTAAFGMPMLEKIDKKSKKVQAVILSPTRELCQQIANQLEAFSKYDKSVKVVSVFGGASVQGQLNQLKDNPQIIVGTPGRFIDFLKRGKIKLDHLKVIILDEADEMLNMGFKEDMDEILSYSDGEKMTWLFSATMPKEIRRIIKNYMTEPKEVQVISEQQTNKNITHAYSLVRRDDKLDAIMRIVDTHPEMYGLVFCNTRMDTVEISKGLSKAGYRADLLNGDLSQGQRDAVMNRFKSGQLNLLVATDVAARGIDVNDLTHVIHHRLPDQLENYTHRSGRTARAGKKGISLSLISGKDKSRVSNLERTLKVTMDHFPIPVYSDVAKIRRQHWLEQLIKLDEDSIEFDEETQAKIEKAIKGITKINLVKKMMSKELAGLSKNKSTEDLNAPAGRERGERGERDRGRGRDRDRGRGRDRDRGRDRKDRDRGGRGESRDRGRGRDDRREERGDRGERSRSRDDKRESRDRNETRDRGTSRDRSSRSDRGDRGSKDFSKKAVENNMSMFRVDVGENALTNKGHLLRLLCEKTGLSKRNFGDIMLNREDSVVSVEHKYSHQFHFNFKGTKVDGKKVNVEVVNTGKKKNKK